MGLKGVDLIPEERRKITFDPVIIFLIIIVICSVGVFWVVGKNYDAKIANRKAEVEKIKIQIEEIRGKIPEIDRIKKEISDLKIQIAMIESLLKDPLKYSVLLVQLKKIMPANVWVKNLSIDPGSNMVTMSGDALGLPNVPPLLTIAHFIKTLQGSPLFGEANLKATSQSITEKGISYSFQIDVQFNPQKAVEVAGGGSL